MALPENYKTPGPEIMAIGDSLYQGVRSMTIRSDLCQNSTPAQVARAFGWRFASPDMPQPIVTNMEEWLRSLDLSEIDDSLGELSDFWYNAPTSPSGRPCFDNISVAGSELWHLYDYTPARATADLADLAAQAGGTRLSFKHSGLLSSWIYACNTRFTLNPMNDPDLAGMTQIDLVKERKPKRLLVNIGSNNGLWDMCFEARNCRMYFGPPDVPPQQRSLADYNSYEQVYKLAEALASLDVPEIYFNSLARPRGVANLMPTPDHVEWTDHPEDGYFPQYENRFGLAGYGTFDAATMARLDQYVAQENGRIHGILAGKLGGRLRWVDMYGFLDRIDAKHWGDDRGWRSSKGYLLTNNMFESGFVIRFAHGGMFGLDGMHPTFVGYGMMARNVLSAMGGDPSKVDLNALARQDGLIEHAPSSWTALMFLWRDIRRARGRVGNDPGKKAGIQAMQLGAASLRPAAVGSCVPIE